MNEQFPVFKYKKSAKRDGSRARIQQSELSARVIKPKADG